MRKRKGKYLIIEATEFNFGRMNTTPGMGLPNVDDPALSINAFDKHEDIIRGAIAKIGDLQKSLGGSPAYQALKSKLSLDDQDVTELKVIRIVKNNNLNYDVYISFKIGIDEETKEYWGVAKNILGEVDIKSEVFKDQDLIQTKEWKIKLKGFLVKQIKAWIKPQFGIFKLLIESITCYSSIEGKMLKMPQDTEIEVLRAYDDRIIFKHENEQYTLTGDNFIYFNYWFERIG